MDTPELPIAMKGRRGPPALAGAPIAVVLAVVVAVLAVGVCPAPVAAAPSWPPPAPGNPGHSNQEIEPFIRPSDRAEAREKSRSRPLPEIRLPGMPGPPLLRPPTTVPLSGPTTLDDLHLVSDGKGGLRGRRPGYTFSIDPDGTIHFADRPSIGLSPLYMLGLLVVFDLTDLVMRMHGEDPYSYDKAKVAALTRDLRTKMVDADREKLLHQASRNLPKQLAFLWGRSDLTAQARRALLFSLWDELLENTASEEGKAAARARGVILEFVRQRLPAGSPDAYSAAELAQLNAGRRSREVFAPYEGSSATR